MNSIKISLMTINTFNYNLTLLRKRIQWTTVPCSLITITVHSVISHRVIFALLHLLTSLPCLKFTQTQSFYKIDDSVNSSNLKFANWQLGQRSKIKWARYFLETLFYENKKHGNLFDTSMVQMIGSRRIEWVLP